MALPVPFDPPPNTPLLPDPTKDSIWRRWFEQLWKRTAALNSGTVTSVALTAPAEFIVAGSPITTSGTLAITKATEAANKVWAGPTTGSAAQPTFRSLVAADLPAGTGTVTSIDVSGGTTGLTTSGGPITTSGTITLAGDLNAAHGGTGFTSYAVGDLLYADTTTTLAKLADVAVGSVLISGGIGVAPSWGAVPPSSAANYYAAVHG